jgi:hypothetical protein
MPRLATSRASAHAPAQEPANAESDLTTPVRKSPTRTGHTLKTTKPKKRKAADGEPASSPPVAGGASRAPREQRTVAWIELARDRLSLFTKRVLTTDPNSAKADPKQPEADTPEVRHAYIVSGAVMSTFEWSATTEPTPARMKLEGGASTGPVSVKREPGTAREGQFSMEDIVEHSIDDIRLLLCTLSEEEARHNVAVREVPEARSIFVRAGSGSGSGSGGNGRPTGAARVPGIEACLQAAFKSPRLRLIGCHLARREYADGGSSFAAFGDVLARLLAPRHPAAVATAAAADAASVSGGEDGRRDVRRARLVQRVVRACLEGLRAPSAAEAQLMSQQQLATMRRAFVRAVAVDTPVIASIARQYMALIPPGQITQKLPWGDGADLDDALFIFDRVISSCVHDGEGCGAAQGHGGRRGGGVLFNFAELCTDGRMLHLINAAIDDFADKLCVSSSPRPPPPSHAAIPTHHRSIMHPRE